MDLFFFARVLLCLKALVVIGFTVFALYVGKEWHRLQNLSDSETGVAVKSCRREMIFQWNVKTGPFPPTSLHEWLIECLFVLRFYGLINPMGSSRTWSVYLSTRLLGRLSPLSG